MQCNHKFKSGRGPRRRQCQSDAVWERSDWTVLALEIETANRKGVQAVSKSWKRQDNRFSPGASRKKCHPADSLTLDQWDPFWTPDLQQGKVIRWWVFKMFYLFMHWLCWVFVTVHGLLPPPQAGAPAPCSPPPRDGLSCCPRSTGSRAGGHQRLWCQDSALPQHVESSWSRGRTCVPCIGRLIHNHWTAIGKSLVF